MGGAHICAAQLCLLSGRKPLVLCTYMRTCTDTNFVRQLMCRHLKKTAHLDGNKMAQGLLSSAIIHPPQEYVGLKTLYLEQNALSEIENLEKLVELRCLYLGRNIISQVRAGFRDSVDMSTCATLHAA